MLLATPSPNEDDANIKVAMTVFLTGLGLLAFREAASMGTWLAIHLGFVLALFLTMPYGKFAHGVFRSAALLKFAIEKRQPTQLALPEA